MTLAYTERQGSTLVIVNNNPSKRGALSKDLYEAIQEALEGAKAADIRAIVIRSEGNFFCSGGDLNALRERKTLTLDQRRDELQLLHDCIAGLRHCDVPVIAAVEGGAAGAGLSLALACDILVSSTAALFTASYVKAGVVPDGGLTAALARMLPRQMTLEMCLLARPVEAERLAQLGVISHLTEPGSALSSAFEYAEAFAKGPRKAQSTIKRLIGEAYEQSEADQLDAEREAMIRAVADSEAQIGIAAFLNKQTPEYP